MKQKLFAALALVLLASSGPLAAATPKPAIISAKAQRSLLLDVARAGDRLVAVGERGHILLSDDQGGSWRQVPVPVRSMLTTVYFVNAKQGWVVGHDSVVLATADAGETWQLQHYTEFSAAAPAPIDNSADAAIDDEEYLDDTESSGRDVGSREGVPLLDAWFADGKSGVAIGAYGLLLRTTDGGKSWRDASASVVNRDGWHFNAIGGIPGNDRFVLIAGEKGTLYRSLDGGATFAPLASPYDGSFFGVVGSADGAIYIFGLQGRLYRSENEGASWTRLETTVTSGLNDGCQLRDGTVLVTGNAGVVLARKPAAATVTASRRADRQAVLSCAAAGDGVVLVGEGGAKRAAASGLTP